MAFITGPFPIDWFGDRKGYEKSKLKVVTVGINPSYKEFGDNPVCPNLEKFPSAKVGDKDSQKKAFNEYFNPNHKPLSWFNSYENILNGLDATYYPSKKKYSIKAIHTDLCSPFATFPTWTKLSDSDQEALMQGGVPQWEALIEELKPDVIIAALKKDDMKALGKKLTEKSVFMTISQTQDGGKRKKELIIKEYTYYNGLQEITFINGESATFNIPFGDLSKEQRQEIGRNIYLYLYSMENFVKELSYGVSHGTCTTKFLVLKDKKSVSNAVEIIRAKFSDMECSPEYSHEGLFDGSKPKFKVKVIDCGQNTDRTISINPDRMTGGTIVASAPQTYKEEENCVELYINFESTSEDNQRLYEGILCSSAYPSLDSKLKPRVVLCVKEEFDNNYYNRESIFYLAQKDLTFLYDESPLSIPSAEKVIENLKNEAQEETMLLKK